MKIFEIGKQGNLNTDRGSVTLLFAAVTFVLASLTVLVADCETTIISIHKISNTADLAALAGAAQFTETRPQPCLAAAQVAQENSARLIACNVAGTTVSVTVEQGGRPDIVTRLLHNSPVAQAKAGL